MFCLSMLSYMKSSPLEKASHACMCAHAPLDDANACLLSVCMLNKSGDLEGHKQVKQCITQVNKNASGARNAHGIMVELFILGSKPS